MKRTIKLGHKLVGDGHPAFIVFEAGPTHNGFESATKLIKVAADSGADAIKFQIFDPDQLISDKSVQYEYDVLIDRSNGLTERISEPLYDIFVRRSLKEKEWTALKDYADSLGLVFFATIGDEYGLELIKKMNCSTVKVASADVNYFPWLRRIAKLGLSIQLDTGNATLGEVEEAVDVILSEGNDSIIIHNCPSGYPAKLESINLNSIPTLKQMFGCPVAYSDHTPGEVMDVAALAIGANMVEKTITFDRTTRSVEHLMSLEPDEMIRFVQTVRDVECAMGNTRRLMSDAEKKNRLVGRRSTILDQDVEVGELLGDVKVTFKRPGYGIGPDDYEKLKSHCFNRALRKGHVLNLKNIQ